MSGKIRKVVPWTIACSRQFDAHSVDQRRVGACDRARVAQQLVAPDALQQRPRTLDRIDDAHDQRAVRVARSGAGSHGRPRGLVRIVRDKK